MFSLTRKFGFVVDLYLHPGEMFLIPLCMYVSDIFEGKFLNPFSIALLSALFKTGM